MKVIRRTAKAMVAAATVILFLFADTAYGQPDGFAADTASELKKTEQALPKPPERALEPGADENKEAALQEVTPEDNAETVPPITDYIKALPGDLLGGTKRILSRDNLPLAIIGSGLTLVALTADGKAKRESLEDHPLGKFRNVGNTLGDGFVEVAASGGLFLTGQLIDDRKLADTGAVSLEACLIDGVATEALKYAVGRRRPNGNGDKMSFPSGHTSVTAAFAASVSEMYDWDPRLAVPLYATVALVGISRMDSNMHYLSDVLAGATLGTLVGSSVAKYHKEKKTGPEVSYQPVWERDFKGIIFSRRF